MNQSSKRQKGRRLVLHLVKLFREQLDDTAYEITGSGSGIDKNDIRLNNLNIEIECKNADQIHLVEDFEQLKRQITKGNIGALAIRNPKKPEFEETYFVLNEEDFINLASKIKEEITIIGKIEPRMKYKIQNTVQSLKEIIKYFDN